MFLIELEISGVAIHTNPPRVFLQILLLSGIVKKVGYKDISDVSKKLQNLHRKNEQ